MKSAKTVLPYRNSNVNNMVRRYKTKAPRNVADTYSLCRTDQYLGRKNEAKTEDYMTLDLILE